MEVKGPIERDKFGRPFILVSLSFDNIDTIQEALVKTIQDTKEPDEQNIRKMKALEPEFLKLRNQMRPS